MVQRRTGFFRVSLCIALCIALCIVNLKLEQGYHSATRLKLEVAKRKKPYLVWLGSELEVTLGSPDEDTVSFHARAT